MPPAPVYEQTEGVAADPAPARPSSPVYNSPISSRRRPLKRGPRKRTDHFDQTLPLQARACAFHARVCASEE